MCLLTLHTLRQPKEQNEQNSFFFFFLFQLALFTENACVGMCEQMEQLARKRQRQNKLNVKNLQHVKPRNGARDGLYARLTHPPLAEGPEIVGAPVEDTFRDLL